MENKKFIISLLTFLLSPNIGFSYSPDTTHAALTQESVALFSSNFDLTFSDHEIESLVKGSIEEDFSVRPMYHFFDPVEGKGLTFGKQWRTSKDWAENRFAQAKYDPGYEAKSVGGTLAPLFGAKTDYSWERSIYEYAWGDKERGLEGLGHILHLIQDATVPDHTRNDPHPPYMEGIFHESSPYEKWTSKFNRESIRGLSREIIKKGIKIPISVSLAKTFDETAKYSNNNFFSKDTILNGKYSAPQIETWKEELLGNGFKYKFGYSSNGIPLVAVRAETWRKSIDKTKYIINDPDFKILNSYWANLSIKAITEGTGVIKLFFDEVEKEKKTKVLYEKNRSWLAKKVDEFKSGTFGIASILYGSSVELSDLENEGDLKKSEVPDTPDDLPRSIHQASEPIVSESTEDRPILPDIPIEKLEEPEIPNASAPITPETPSPGISLPPPLGSFMGGGGAPPLPEIREESDERATEPAALPSISLSIDQCQNSLAVDGCLIADTAIEISWSSSSTNIARYNVTCESSGASCAGFSYSETGTSTTYTASDGSEYIFRAKAIDESGAESEEVSHTVAVNTNPIIINEIAWMGTSETQSADEWIELYNRTGYTINVSDWTLYSETDFKPYLPLSGSIGPRGYYLIERTDDTTTSVLADLTAPFGSGSGSGLSNFGEVLALSQASTTRDRTPQLCNSNWCGGNSTTYFTMERYDPDAAGTLASNWGANNQAVACGQNADGLAIWGTPKRRNSLNHRIILNANSTLSESTSLSLSRSPYVITQPMTVAAGATLSVEPGSVLKFASNGELTVNGTLIANGTAANPIIFTSIKDDTPAGDTNGDGSTTTPAKGDWKKIKFSGNGSVLSYVEARFGGSFSGNSSSESRAMIFANGAQLTVSNSVIEESANIGISLSNATSSVIRDSTIRNHNAPEEAGYAPTGISIGGGNGISILNNTFSGNRTGLGITNSTPEISGNIFSAHISKAISVAQGAIGTVFESNQARNNPFNGISVNGSLTESGTLAADLPYTGIIQVGSLGSLTIPAGTVLKGLTLTSSGVVFITGESGRPVVFTALSDDMYGGDSDNNGDTSATCAADPSNASCPQPGSWTRITLSGNTATSSIQYARIRFGNSINGNGAVYINGGNADIQNSTIEYSRNQGVQITPNGIATISGSTFNNNGTGVSNDGWLTLSESIFRNNSLGLASPVPSTFIDGNGNDIDSSNTTRTTPATLLP